MSDFERVHNMCEGFSEEEARLPEVEFTEETVIMMMDNVSHGKAIVFDGVSDEWFRIRTDADCSKLLKGGNKELC